MGKSKIEKAAKKAPYSICSLIVGFAYIERILFPVFSWAAILLLTATGVLFVFSVISQKDFFQAHIGGCWTILPIIVTPTVLLKRNTEWNVVALICVGLCAGALFTYLWTKKRRNEDTFSNLKGIGICGFVTVSVLFLIISLNEMIIIKVSFIELNLNEKYVYDVPHSTSEEYYVSAYDKQEKTEKTFSVSEKYYESLEAGDKINLCVCTGSLNVDFYFLYEDPEMDLFHLNNWAQVRAQKEKE